MQQIASSTQHPSSMQTLKRLLGYIKDRKGGLALAMLGMAGYGAVDTSLVYSIQPLIDDGLSGKNPHVLFVMAFVVTGLVFLRGISAFLSDYFMSWVGSHVVMKLQRQVFSHMMGMPMSFFDRNNTGALLSKVTYDAGQVSSAASSTLVALIREGITVIGLLGMMFYHSWKLSIIFFIVGPVVGLLLSFISRRFRRVSRQIQHAMGSITTSTEQMLRGHKEVLMFGGQEVESRRFDQVSNHMRNQNMKMVVVDAFGSSMVQVIASSALTVLLIAASMPGVISELTPGTFSLILTSMMMLLKPLKSLTQINNQFQRGITASQSLFDLIDQPLEADTGTRTLEHAKGHIEFRNVTFTYPTKEQPALRDVSLVIEPGKTVALVGRSGSGKSTIASLLTRFYDIDAGQILLDGHDIREYRLRDLRRQFALVSQHVHLFNDTVASNIAYAAEEAFTQEQIAQAARVANAEEFILKMPQGYQTVVGENGANLSGGQRQRLAIARALLRNTPVLLLDEATSALDTESERHIQAALDNLARDRTTLVIAHRLSTIENADEILVVDEGRIIERGDHASLMAKNGAYAQLRNTQFGEKA